MNSKLILLVGFIVSTIYITFVMYLYTPNTKEIKSLESNTANFVYVLDDKNITAVSKLSYEDEKSSLVGSLDDICQRYTCKTKVDFSSDISPSSWIEVAKDLVDFSLKHSLSSSSLVIENDTLEINFRLKSKEELEMLSLIYDEYKTSLNIVDNSSVVKFYSIQNIEDEVNKILINHKIVFNTLEVDKKSVKVLNRAFKRLRELGKTDVTLFSTLDEVEAMLLQDYILKNYRWIKKLSLKNSDRLKIKIEEVLK